MDSQHKSAGQIRRQFSAILDAAEKGRSTIVTRRGKPVAALIPISDYKQPPKQLSILDLRGSGRGYWGKDSTAFIRKLRDEWDR